MSDPGLTVKQRYRVKRYVRTLADRANADGELQEELIRLMLSWATDNGFEAFQKIRTAAADAAELHAWLRWQDGHVG